MSTFSEYLTYIKESRNMTGAYMANICDKDVSVVFCWLNGKRFPKNWSQIETLVDKLQLTDEEHTKLKLNKIAARWPAKAVAQFFYFF